MSAKNPVLWALTTGTEGCERQCRGVAQALGLRTLAQHIRPTRWSRWFAPYAGVSRSQWRALIAQPMPDILLAAGRHAIPYALALKRHLRQNLFAAAFQHPRAGLKQFDLIWVPEHDKLQGTNVIRTLTSPHDIDEAARQKAAQALLAKLPSNFSNQRVGVLLGGPNKAYAFSHDDMHTLGKHLGTLAAQGWGVLCVLSRRTPAFVAPLLQNYLPAHSCFLGFPQGVDNPYLAVLGLSDCFIVTADSVNMLGEAASTGRGVHIAPLRGEHKKFTQFHDQLIATGAARHFTGQLAIWSYSALNSTKAIAERLRTDYERQHPHYVST